MKSENGVQILDEIVYTLGKGMKPSFLIPLLSLAFVWEENTEFKLALLHLKAGLVLHLKAGLVSCPVHDRGVG